MNQPRSFLLIAWLIVAFLLWDAWQKDYATVVPEASLAVTAEGAGTAESAADSGTDESAVPQASLAPDVGQAPAVSLDSDDSAPARTVVLANDVLRLTLDTRGGSVVEADLLQYDQEARGDSPPVQLLSSQRDRFFAAHSGWISREASAPSHEDAFQLVSAPGTDASIATFRWTSDDGVEIDRTYSLEPGEYVLTLTDTIRNGSTTPWQASAYHQLQRVPPPSKGSGFTNPEAYSFVGMSWFSPQDRFEKLAFDDFDPEEPLAKDVTGGWIAMLQHYFFVAWIPAPELSYRLSTAKPRGGFVVRAIGALPPVAPAGEAVYTARLYLGPKLQDRLQGIAPGLGLTLDYGIFTILAEPLAWLLGKLHALTGNWGWAIVLLVVLIKLALFKLSESQYKSFAKMRRVQPRIEALKERYGDDRQKFQMAMMELYKKEKINPVGGCLPVLLQFPVFIALYWVLLESVELRHAPWIGWIQNLTAPDPYFVLPVINLATMWLTQKLSPTPGMDPMQKRMMQIMPLVFGVLFAFFPAGLVLYWATNGALGLLQQWVITRRHGEPSKA